MESQVKTGLFASAAVLLLVMLAVPGGVFESRVGGAQPEPAGNDAGQMRLRKAVGVRTYKGRDVEGENRLIERGDSLWRILIQEKGLQEKRFSQYVIIIRGLNPEIKKPDFLKVGDNVFIPLRPDEIVEARSLSQETPKIRTTLALGTTKDYRVKRGDHLYQILREQLGISDERELAVYYALTKDLNPGKNEWDFLQEGEMIRLPTTREESRTASAPSQVAPVSKSAELKAVAKENKPQPERTPETTIARTPRNEQRTATPSETSARAPAAKAAEVKKEVLPELPAEFAADRAREPGAQSGEREPAPAAPQGSPVQTIPPRTLPALPLDYARQLPATDNLPLISQIVKAVGSETQHDGEETFALDDSTVRVDRRAYPIIYSRKLRQRVVIDPQDNIPASLREKLDDPRVAAPVLPLTKGSTLQEAIGQLLSRLGYQPLPGDRPVVIQEGGISYEAKGNWMALAPQESDKPQEILVITLTKQKGDIPDYLKSELARKGVHLEDVLLSASVPEGKAPVNSEVQRNIRQAKNWPREKKEIVDALLLTYGIPFGVLETHSVQLRDGLTVDKRVDRIFNLKGKRTALFFGALEPEIKSAMIEKDGMNVIEMDLPSLAPRELIARMLHELGEKTSYRQHRFAAGNGNSERLKIAAWGFLLTSRSAFLTDREIPRPLQRFFFEKGLDIVYFQ